MGGIELELSALGLRRARGARAAGLHEATEGLFLPGSTTVDLTPLSAVIKTSSPDKPAATWLLGRETGLVPCDAKPVFLESPVRQ